MEKRYQVFVSSTYQDLQDERQEVMHALLELDCMPSGMELFPAANESQWSLIKKVIEDCDYYILILAGRYGSCNAEGVGYTELEYKYAVSIGKPIIAFLHKDPGSIQARKCESTKEGKEKLAAFRELVERRLCKQWSSPEELGSVVSRSLIRLIKTTPAVGWVRGDELPDRDATLELLKLRERVEDLESELSKARTTAPTGSEDLAQGEELHKLRFAFVFREAGTYTDNDLMGSFVATWDRVFSTIAPLMINEAPEVEITAALDDLVKTSNFSRLRKEKRFKNGALKRFSLIGEDFQTIKVQFRALGLITESERPRSVKDAETYWTLTPYGDSTMTRLRAIKRASSRREDLEGSQH